MYTAEEQAEHRKQWAEALRSGKYEQGLGRLRDGDKFCCLGVACDISGLGEWSKEIPKGEYMFMTTVLPEAVKEWIGVQHNSPCYYRDDKIRYLAKDNDEGYSFNEIARFIEDGCLVLKDG